MRKLKFVIDCKKLSREDTNHLADDLSDYFGFVHNSGNLIIADNPSKEFYTLATLQLIDRYHATYTVSESD